MSNKYQEKFGESMRLAREEKEKKEPINIREVLYRMSYSPERRKLILAWLSESPNNRFPVNDRYTLQIYQDSDLQKLLKQGKIKQIRIPAFGKKFSKIWKHAGKAETYIVLS